MRIANETAYASEDLRRAIEAACKATTTDEPRLVQVVYNRRVDSGWHGGWAWRGSKRIKLTVPRPPRLDVKQLAQTVEHELAHLRGVDHKHMADPLLRCVQPVPWAEGLTVRTVTEPEPVKVLLHPAEAARRRAEGQAKAAERREGRAREALAEAEAKLRRLQRRVSMLRAKVRYYDRKAAARPW